MHLPNECVTTQRRKEGENRKEREKNGRKKKREKAREKEQLTRERGRKRSTQYTLKLTTVSSLELIQESVSCCLLRPLLITINGGGGWFASSATKKVSCNRIRSYWLLNPSQLLVRTTRQLYKGRKWIPCFVFPTVVSSDNWVASLN